MQWSTGLQILGAAFKFVGLAAATIPYKEYILAPPSRIIRPESVYGTNGTAIGAENLLSSSASSTGSLFLGVNSSVTYDFGKNIAGWVTLVVGETSARSVNVTFSESSLWISGEACDATADAGLDSPLVFALDGAGAYTAPEQKERGGFRYMSIVAGEPVEIAGATVYFTPMPHWGDEELQEYTGWFHCSDDQINRVWYAGAYTNQMCTIDATRGDSLVWLGVITGGDSVEGTTDWYYNYTITNGTSALTDGAKRDRLVWAGDMAIAVPGLAVSTFDLVSVVNSLDSLFALQLPDGQLPYAGDPFTKALPVVSFTYHLYTLIGVADYYHWSGDIAYLRANWPAWKLAVDWATAQIDGTGLAFVTAAADWLRFGMGAHNIEANSILYHTLTLGIALATAVGDTSVVGPYALYQAGIKQAANALLWDPEAGLYKDNQTTTLHPQDGNVWAIKAGIVPTPSHATTISRALRARWGPYGAPAPEAADAVSPFISGFELEAHFRANETEAGLGLVRVMWGDFMLDDPRMTNSTFVEGYSVTGELHYAPYRNDARISHAHGWATGPTSTLTMFVAGIQLLSESGRTWSVAPQLGDLEYAEAGFSTALGLFSSAWKRSSSRTLTLEVETPEGTTGRVGIPTGGKGGILEVSTGGKRVLRMRYSSDEDGRFWMEELEGGVYTFKVFSDK